MLTEKYYISREFKYPPRRNNGYRGFKVWYSSERMKHVAVVKKSGVYRKPNHNSPKV